ncbi:response regulator [Candidatus Latescibacterota bacterium]
MKDKNTKILLFEDDQDDQGLIAQALKDYYDNICCVTTGEECLEELKNDFYDVVLLDYSLPDYNGLEVLQQIIDIGIQIPVIMITGQGDESIAAESIKIGAYDYVNKSSFERIVFSIKSSISRYNDKVEILNSKREKKNLRNQLIQAQKMEAISTLAGGIAHDFNNILGVILGYSEMAQLQNFPESSQVPEFLEEIQKAGFRAKDLVKQILTFSRVSSIERNPIKISLIFKETMKLLRSSLPATIKIVQEITTESDLVYADPTQIKQALMDLCSNSAHAMSENGGTLTVSLSDETLDSESSAVLKDIEPGEYLKITISDTGHGISPDILDRIYEPYFTTKKKGEGTGMGLSMVHGIVKGHDGAITVESTEGVGTSFKILLPKFKEHSEPPQKDESPFTMGSGKILFVDDEESIIRMYERMLSNLGYEVVSTSDSLDALEKFRKASDTFDLVITDQTMPNMTGIHLAENIMEIRPDIPIILCTGNSEIMTASKVKSLGIRELLLKPIKMNDLLREIRSILGKES